MLAIASTGCDQPASDPVSDATFTTPSAPAPLAEDLVTTAAFEAPLGAVVFVPVIMDGEISGHAFILGPTLGAADDSLTLRDRVGGGDLSLLTRQGLWGRATLGTDFPVESSAQGCPGWSSTYFSDVVARDSTAGLGTGAPRSGWLLALPAGQLEPLSLDSIEALSSRDSSAFAVQLTRAASALPEDSLSPFRGLPFTVVRGYRLISSDTTVQGIGFGVLVRRIPQEDRPLEERLLVAIAPSATRTRTADVVWHERASGREEEVVATEPVAAGIDRRNGRLTVFLARDDGTGTAVAILIRAGQRWRLSWDSGATDC